MCARAAALYPRDDAVTAVIGAFEALLFSVLGHVVDWLAQVQPARLWSEQRGHLLLLAAVLAASTLLVALQTMFKQQTLRATSRCGCAGTSTA